MKTITFIRHAKSDWSASLKDISRTLNKRGQKNAPEMGKRLKKLDYRPQLICVSPAVRTQNTMDLLIEKAGWNKSDRRSEDWMYMASVSDYINYLEKLDHELTSIAFCGHNPAITEIVTFLSGEYILNMATCAVAIIEFDIDDWRLISGNTGRLVHFDYPKKEEEKK